MFIVLCMVSGQVHHARCRCNGLKTPSLAAVALETSVEIDFNMTDFSTGAPCAVYQAAAGDDAATHAGPESDHDHFGMTVSGAFRLFPKRRHIGIIINDCRRTAQFMEDCGDRALPFYIQIYTAVKYPFFKIHRAGHTESCTQAFLYFET